MKENSVVYKPVSTVKLTAIIVLAVSIIFPLLFSYINGTTDLSKMQHELVLMPLRLGGIAVITFVVIKIINKIKGDTELDWLRYIVELPVIWFFSYWWLLFVLQYIEAWWVCNGCVFPTDTWNFRQYMGLFGIATVIIYIFQSGLNFYQLAQQKTAEAEKLQKEFAQLRLQALKNQVNPHFLFNSLSVLSSLVHVSPETSDKFIQQLSKAYRYILDQKDLQWVTLKAELDFLDAYFFLLQIRFDNKVQLRKNISVDELNYTLPPLTLQLLIENAVKHNKMSTSHPLIIEIFNEEDYLVVRNNTNKREQHETSTGIGLENIRKRYQYITDKKIDTKIENDCFIVRIPLIKNQ